MSSVDERIVKMTFDNDEFEQGIKESSDSLTKFKQSLSKDTSATTLDNVSSTLSKMNFSSVLSGIESMTSRFSVFGISAATVIQDVTRKIESMADTLVSAITTDPVSAGWDEYELKMNSVQTIMSSTGEDIETVNQYLDELNQYADDTIYSFSDMTESIGKFTNSGVSLEDAVTAIKGISNEAAVSGANANEASRAMYNFAQALSTGYVALIDWKSIENANMATKEFKEQLLETAVACGTVEETSDGMYKVLTENASGSTLSDAIDATNGFRDSLSYQWLTTEVLIETLKDYGDATTEIGAKASAAATEVKTFSMLIDTLKEAMGSGWTETWETVFGNLEEAKEGWTAVSEALGAVIDKSADSRNAKLSGAMDSSWDQLLQRFTDAGISADDFNDTMQELAINTGKVTEEMIEDAGGIENTLSKGWLTTDLLNDAIAKLGGVTTSSASEAKYSLEECKDVVEDIIAGVYGNGSDRVSALEELGYDAEELQKIVDKVWNGSALDWDKYTEETATNLSECQQIVENIVKGTYGNGAARTSALEELGYDAEQLQTIVNAVWDGSTLNWDNYTEEALIAAGATEEEAEALMELKTNMGLTDDELQQFVDDLNGGKASGRELLWDSILNTIEGLSRILGTVGSAWKNVFGTTTSEQIYNVIAAIEGFTEKLLINQETANKLQRTFRGLFSILSIIKTTVSAVVSRVFKAFSSTLGGLDIDILGFTGDLGLAIDRFRQWYESNDIANKAIDAMVPLLKKAENGLKSMVSKAAEIPEVAQVIEALKNVFESLKDEIQNGFPTLQKWFGNFTEWLGTLDELTLEDVKQTFKELFTTLKDGKLTFDFPTLDKIKEKFPKAGEAIQNFIDKIKNFDTPTLDKISEKIKSLIEAFQNGDKGFKFPTLTELSELFPNVADILSSAMEKIQWVLDSLSSLVSGNGDAVKTAEDATTVFDAIGQALSALQTGIGETVSNIDVGQILGIATVILSIVSVLKLLSAVGKFANLAQSVGSFVDELSGIMKKVSKSSALANDAKTSSSGIEKFRSVVVSLAILAGVLVVLGKQNTGDLIKAGAAITIMAGIAIGIQALTGLLSKKGLSGSLNGVGTTLIALAAALYIVVEALKQLNKISADRNMGVSFLIVVGIIAALAAGIGVMQFFSPVLSKGQTTMKKMAVTVLALTVALKLVVSALEDLTKMDFTAADIAVLAGMFTALVAAVAILSKLSGGVFGISSATVLSILALPIALKILISALKDIADMPLSDIISSIPKLLIIVAEMAIISKVSTIGSGTSGGGATILAMAASIVLIAVGMKMLASINEEDLGRATTSMLAIMAMLTVFVAVANATAKTASTGGKIKSGASSLLAAAVAIGVMAAAMVALSMIDDDKLAMAMAAILTLAVSLTAMEAFSGFTGKGSASSILAMAVVIGVLAASVGLLANLTDASALKNATNCLSQLIVMFGVLEVVSSLAGIFGTSCIAPLAATIVVVGLLALIVSALSNFTDPTSLKTTCDGLSEMMNSLSKMLAVVAIVGAFGLAGIGAGLVGVVAALGTVALIAAAFAALNEYAPGIMSFMNSGMAAFGEFIGSFIGGIVVGMANVTGFADLADDISGFVENLEPALTALSGVDSSVVDNAGNLASALLKITAAEVLDGIAGLLGTNMDDFSDGLVTFGEALADFADKTKDISSDSLGDALEVVEELVDIYDAIDKTGGLVGMFTGNQSWTDFGDGLSDFGTALSDFSKNVSGDNAIDSTAISTATSVMTDLSAIYNDLDNVGGIVDIFAGHKDWTAFGEGLPEFGTAIAGFASALKQGGFDSSSVDENWGTAITTICGVIESIPDMESLSWKFESSTNEDLWGSIQTGMESFVGLLQYLSTVTGLDSGAIDSIKTATDSLKILKNDVPNGMAKDIKDRFVPTKTTWEEVQGGIEAFATMISGVSDIGTGVNTSGFSKLTTSAKKLNSLKDDTTGIVVGTAKDLLDRFDPDKTTWEEVGNAINAFGTMCSNISATTVNTSNLESLATAAASIKTLKTNMPETSGWKKLMGSESEGTDWTSIGSGLEAFGTAMQTFSDLTVDLDTTAIDTILIELEDLCNLASVDMPSVGGEAITDILTSMLDGVSTDYATTSLSSVANLLISTLTTQLSDTIANYQASFDEPILDAIAAAILEGSDSENLDISSYETLGDTLSQKVGTGLSDSTSISTAAQSAADSGITAVRKKYDGFVSAGKYLMEGLAQGISNNQYKAINAATTTAKNTLTALNNALDEHSPSKASRQSGQYLSEGLALGIADLADRVADESSSVGSAALSALAGVSDKISSYLSEEQSFTPSITPVLDLTNVSSGAQKISGMLGRSYGLNIDTAKINTLSAAMQNRQNGSTNDDVVAAIKKLNGTMSTDRQNIYNVNGVTYDDGSNVSSAVQQLVRAASIARRA